MAATNTFISIPNREVISGWTNNQGINEASNSTGADPNPNDFIELRIMTTTAGAAATNVTKWDVIKALETFKRWIIEGGLTTGADTNLPPI